MTIDRTPAGGQYVLPGAEKATHATMAQRGCDAPLRSTKPTTAPRASLVRPPPQHAGPLFSDGASQLDLLDAIRRTE